MFGLPSLFYVFRSLWTIIPRYFSSCQTIGFFRWGQIISQFNLWLGWPFHPWWLALATFSRIHPSIEVRIIFLWLSCSYWCCHYRIFLLCKCAQSCRQLLEGLHWDIFAWRRRESSHQLNHLKSLKILCLYKGRSCTLWWRFRLNRMPWANARFYVICECLDLNKFMFLGLLPLVQHSTLLFGVESSWYRFQRAIYRHASLERFTFSFSDDRDRLTPYFQPISDHTVWDMIPSLELFSLIPNFFVWVLPSLDRPSLNLPSFPSERHFRF